MSLLTQFGRFAASILLLQLRMASPQLLPINSSLLCSPTYATFDGSNATGTVLFQNVWVNAEYLSENPYARLPSNKPMILNNSLSSDTVRQNYSNLAWSMSVYDGLQSKYPENITMPALQQSLFVGQPPDVNLYDGSVFYSGCAFIFSDLPNNTIRRGQDDGGDCQATLSNDCLKALNSRVADYAYWQVANPTQGPFSNLTPPILNPICDNILNSIGTFTVGEGITNGATFPSECIPYFSGENMPDGVYPQLQVVTLTSNTTEEFSGDCYLQNSTILPDYTLRAVSTTFKTLTNDTATDNANYDAFVQDIFPILTVTFPQANNSRIGGISGADAEMVCVRANMFSPNSRVPPALPAASPVDLGGLSTAAKVGIAVGVILAVLIVAGLVFWFLRRRKLQRKNQRTADKEGALVNGSKQHQLDGKHSAELHGGSKADHEMEASIVSPTEMSSKDIKEAAGVVPLELEGQAHHKSSGVIELAS